MALSVQRLQQVRRWAQEDPSAHELIERAWELLPSESQPLAAQAVLGPVGLIQQEVKTLGWTWMSSPWAFERVGAEAVPLVRGPNGAFAHAVREAVRHRELARAVKRRP